MFLRHAKNLEEYSDSDVVKQVAMVSHSKDWVLCFWNFTLMCQSSAFRSIVLMQVLNSSWMLLLLWLAFFFSVPLSFFFFFGI